MIPPSSSCSSGVAAHDNRWAVGVNFPAQVRRCIAHRASIEDTAVVVVTDVRYAKDKEDYFGCTNFPRNPRMDFQNIQKVHDLVD